MLGPGTGMEQWRRRSVLMALLGGGLVLSPASLSAQVQNSRMPTAERMRAEYMAEVSTGVQETLEHFRNAIASSNVEAMTRLFADGALYSPSTGESHYGIEAIRTAFETRLKQVGRVLLTRVDVHASGGLAYQFGRYTYGGSQLQAREEGTYVLICLQVGREWRIRTLVEREDPGLPLGQ